MKSLFNTASSPMTSIADIRNYIYGCGYEAVFTIVSVQSKARFTYRFRKPLGRPNFFFMDVLTGSDNESDFSFIGTVRKAPATDRWVFAHSEKSPVAANAPSVIAAAWFVMRTNNGRDVDVTKMEFWHDGRCSKCGRKLTTPESLARGLGPKCAKEV